ncbi:uncharacterized protein LOC120529944 [Polypterus senegalus]|uniref:uncharacterized protein LOC120529944 n=1 Tax=Polypterus senegalus TaxID=55291 RepID=UPI0019646325|nr:uncharacterized protein LOC120529944 [Polypterus senegalus]
MGEPSQHLPGAHVAALYASTNDARYRRARHLSLTSCQVHWGLAASPPPLRTAPSVRPPAAAMRLFFCFVLLSCYSDSGLAIDLIQDKLTVIKGPRKTARIACRLSGSATYVHWYRQKDSEAPDRVLYIPTSGGNPVRDDPTLRQKFNAEKNTDEYTLIIDNTQVEDSATYYCAAWGGVKVFGAGTKLIVSETPAKQPDVSVFRASKDRVACVAYGFFPDVIKFEWKKKVGGKTIDLQGEKDEQLDLPITKIEDGSDKYSATSLLIYKGGNPSFKFVCVVNHEGFTNPAEFIEAIPDGPATSSGRVPAEGDLETDNCKAPYAEGLDFQPFNVATLSYTLFILKSVVYCAVVVYLTYQNKSV